MQEGKAMDQISFKYHPNVWKLGVFKRSRSKKNPPLCQCCGNPTEYYLNYIYAKEEVSCICPACVASGAAAEKFDGCFVATSEYDKINNETYAEELLYRTPGYESQLGERWLACCGDYCAFIGYVTTKDLDEMGLGEDAVANGYGGFRNHLTKRGLNRGFLFQCLHCGKYHVGVEVG